MVKNKLLTLEVFRMDKEIQNQIKSVKDKHIPTGYVYTEAGLLPVEWKFSTLEDITEKITKTAGTDLYETLSISAGIGFVNQAKKFGKELSGKQYEKYIVLNKGDFSYNKGNSKTYPQGCLYRLQNREVAAVPNVFESFRIKFGCAEYYDQLFISGYLNRQLSKKINHGVRDDGLLNLTGKDFYSCFLPVPPIEEQEKIARILTVCDKVIELKEKLIEEKKKQKKVLRKNLLNPSVISKIPIFQNIKWKQINIGDCTTMFSGGTPKSGKSIYYENGTIPFIRSGEIKEEKTVLFLTEEGYKNCSSKMVKKGDLLYALYGANSGDCSISKIDGAINQAVLCIRSSEISTLFMYYTFENLKEHIVSTYLQGGQGNLSADIIKSINICAPNDETTQKKISNIIGCADNEINLYNLELAELKRKKKALTQLLLTGIVRVNKE